MRLINPPSRSFLGALPATEEVITAICRAVEIRAVKIQVAEVKARLDAEIEAERAAEMKRERRRAWAYAVASYAALVIGAWLVWELITGRGPFAGMAL